MKKDEHRVRSTSCMQTLDECACISKRMCRGLVRWIECFATCVHYVQTIYIYHVTRTAHASSHLIRCNSVSFNVETFLLMPWQEHKILSIVDTWEIQSSYKSCKCEPNALKIWYTWCLLPSAAGIHGESLWSPARTVRIIIPVVKSNRQCWTRIRFFSSEMWTSISRPMNRKPVGMLSTISPVSVQKQYTSIT